MFLKWKNITILGEIREHYLGVKPVLLFLLSVFIKLCVGLQKRSRERNRKSER